MMKLRFCFMAAIAMCALPYAGICQGVFNNSPSSAASSHSASADTPNPNTAPQRLCQESDLTGIFQLSDVQENPPGDETTWFKGYPFHYLVFNPDQTYDYIASRSRVRSLGELKELIRRPMLESGRKLSRKYTLEDEGLLKLYIEDRIDYTFRCVFNAKDVGKAKAGDLLFMGYSKNNAELQKIFHPLQLQ